MPARKRRFGLTTKSFVYAVGIHLLVGALLLVSFNFNSSDSPASAVKPSAEPVQATVLTEAEVQKQLEVIEQREQQKQIEQEQAEKRLKDLVAQTREAEKKREEEQRKLAELKRQREDERARELEKKKAQELASKKKEEELAKQKQAEELARKKKEEEKKRREAELARKKKEEEQRRQQELAKKLEEERRQEQAARQEQMFTSALNQYTPIIKQKVSRNWNQPSGTPTGIAAKVNVRLTATGEVMSARVVRSSGSSVFDRSVENAVYKASPLPIPQERGINERFRNLDLIFRPEEMI